MPTGTDRVEKQIVLRAPRSRVWRALTDAKEFGSWFGFEAEGTFTPGGRVAGQDHTQRIRARDDGHHDREDRPERLVSWRWHPHAVDPGADYSDEPKTLVVFELKEVPEGTLLSVVESGFDQIPLARRAQAHRMNDEGWAAQMKTIEQHLAKAS